MRIAIVGGGLTGMSAALDLAQAGHSIHLFEREAALGGLAASFRVNDVLLERFYHHLFTSDTAMTQLIEELGLGGDLHWHPTVTSVFHGGKIWRMSKPIDVLRFSPLSFVSRIRMGMLAILPKFIRDWRPLEAVTAKDWLIRYAGKRGFEVVWEPQLRSKFGSYSDQIAAVWIWNKLKLRGGSRGKGQAENLGYLDGGFGRAVDALEARLRSLGVEIHVSTPVEQLDMADGMIKGVVAGGQTLPFDRVLVTTAPQLMAGMSTAFSPEYREQLCGIEYLSNVCLVLKLNRSLSSTYWLGISDPTIPFVGLVEHTNMLNPAQYGGSHLAYLSRYTVASDPLYSMTAEQLLDAYLPHLRKIYPSFQRDWVAEAFCWRDRYTQPVVGLHYSSKIPALRALINGLWLCSMAQIYPEDRGMNYAVAYGRKVAAEMIGEMAGR